MSHCHKFDHENSSIYWWNCVKSAHIRSFSWSVFSHIRTEYGEILSISPCSVRMRENMDQKKLRIWTLFTQCSTVHILKPYKMSMLHTMFRLEDFFCSHFFSFRRNFWINKPNTMSAKNLIHVEPIFLFVTLNIY